MSELEAALEQLSETEQQERVASYLRDVQRRSSREKRKKEPYAFFKVLRDADLPGPEDASVTYEKKLYGPHGEGNE